ncbi:MAG TPA: TolC family protein [Candidatus Phocaeicola excrementigallinarum]|nr:TolC family protein [Candidatus Phocaeicola excrementigallinarum]
MYKLKQILVSGVIGLFGIAPLKASIDEDSLYLSIGQLFDRGMEQNLQLAADRLKEQIADDRARTARASRLPEINIGLNGGFVGQPVVFEHGLSDPTCPDSPDWSQNYAVNVSQPLYHGGRIRYAIRQADIEKEIAVLQTATDRADIKLSLLRQYLTLFSLYKQHVVLTRNINESERRLKDIRQMKEEGLITNNDVLRSEMQLTNNRLSLLETENNIRLTSQQLDILLGLDESLLLRPDTTLLDEVLRLDEYENYISQAYSNDPAMSLRMRQTDLARNNIQAVKAERMPQLSLYAANTLARPVSRTLADMYNNAWNIGLSFSYPLSALYRSKHRIREARRQVDVYRNAEEQHRQQIRMTVRNAYLKHSEALARVDALKLSVKQAEENFRIMRNRYLNQLAILTDLLDADNLRLDAELQLTTARAQVVYTYYELQRAAGKL